MDDDGVSSGNMFIVCQYKDYVATIGTWLRNPLNYSVPLILLQLSFISLTSMLIDSGLQFLGQTSLVAQIVSGVLIGPSFLAHDAIMGSILFPGRSHVNLETLAVFGIMYFLFAIGVRANPGDMIHPGRHAATLGIVAFFSTFIFTVSFSYLLKNFVAMDETLAKALPYMAASLSMMAFPNISCLLVEVKMCNSQVGKITVTAAMFSDLIGIALTVVGLSAMQSDHNVRDMVLPIVSALVFVLVFVFLIRPLVRKIIKRISTEKSLEDIYVCFFFVGILVAGFVSELIGQHYVLGPLVFGLMVPDGPPLGTALISKLDYFVGKFLYPTFLTTSGLKTNIFSINLWSLWIVILLTVFSCLVKIGSAVCTCRFLDINFQDSVLIGLMFNAKGICELIMFNFWRDAGVLPPQEFALSVVVSVVGTTVIITPLIRYLYDPSKQLIPLKRRTIQHSKRNTELRILVCIQNQETVPSIINLLEASNATEESPIAVIALLLVELVGRATPMLVSHQASLQRSNSKSAQIINALRQYEHCNETCVTIQPFSAISQMQTMQNDVFRVALDQNATIAILPFHKRYEIDGSIGSLNRAMQNMNIKIMDRAPCSIGILVDRGVLTGSLSILNNQSMYHVAVIYLGGPDDAESLCYGARMGRRNNVTLTLVRFLLFGCDNARERKQDNNIIDEVRQANMGNENFVYQEQVVKDGVGLAASLQGLGNGFDLLMVGRNHQATQILMGLGAWSECPELGVVGDILASPDFGSTSSVLVVQQQRLPGDKLKNRVMKPVVTSHHESGNGVDTVGGQSKLEISIDKERISS